tara:strand:- start:1546 stop:1755 length:210 start_codon:yes stop_codon:yes gene_type:complete
MTINKKLVQEGIDELLGMIDNSLETLRDYGEPWNKLFEMDTEDHMELMEDFEKQVLIGVGKKLLEKKGE